MAFLLATDTNLFVVAGTFKVAYPKIVVVGA
jgi:hypothetical protein